MNHNEENLNLSFSVDRPLAFRYTAKTGELAIEAYSQTLQRQMGGGISVLRLELTTEAVQALSILMQTILANPNKDIEGNSSEPNKQ
jgi:hypothetical protein